MKFRPDITGRTVYHCHILPHEDNGMMSAFTILPPQGGTK
jgi:FtsP/CotA-like multicopper oxidase with cupredoxin domain